MTRTHEVLNQSTPLADYDVFGGDRALGEAVAREGAGWAADKLHALGRLAGGEAIAWGVQANKHTPELRVFDRFGHRVDEVEYHPAWHQLMRAGVEHGLHAAPWREPRAGAHVARAASFMVLTQAEAGFGCPISMTYSAVPALRSTPSLAQTWEPRLTSLHYDPRNRPASEKQGAICGMAMTEKQGGSDVRANTTRATKQGDHYELVGHKWFCSAPMSDVFLVLAQTERGLSCFLVPRWRPDGVKNAMNLQRLKDKLGNRSNASSEVELDGAWGDLVGEEGRGVPTIIEMVSHTRLDCCIGAAAGMRYGVAQALHHASHRAAFGKRLIDHALMQNVLADLAIESEAATVTMARLARAYDEAQTDGEARRFARLATAVCKYWLCKRAPVHAAEALECFGGNGYVEESMMPRLYREAPLNGIWEGSGNVICLDVLRAMQKDPASVQLFFGECLQARGEKRIERAVAELGRELGEIEDIESRARRVVERMALTLQASLMLRVAPREVADAFITSRLDGDRGLAFGTLPRGVSLDTILERAAVSS
ncbi:MAG TPA: acyl-CoA dehydrogenase family protein [Polyangia bacterium]|nr:acyl-CoA dehydrogenase family protein [Polyangia bacterium]